jgi:vacuolar-type H+-ATPase subunit I/STV1
VIVDSLPPEATPLGYDVITASGQLLERVPRQLTSQELLDKSTERNNERLRLEEQERLEAWDKSLMLRYSSIEDIDAALSRSLQSVKVRVSILKSNRSSVKSEIELEQSRAADIERRNNEVPQALMDKIDVLSDEIKDIEDSISSREHEMDNIESNFKRDVSRFETLQERINLRNQARPKDVKKRY